MNKIFFTLALLLPHSALAAVGPLINGNQINPQTGISIATFTQTGAAGIVGTKAVIIGSVTVTGTSGLAVTSGPIYQGSGTQISTFTAGSLNVPNEVTAASAVFTSGNVGIGTSSPGSLLDVSGGSITVHGTNAAIGINTNASDGLVFRNSLVNGTVSGGVTWQNSAGYDMAFIRSNYNIADSSDVEMGYNGLTNFALRSTGNGAFTYGVTASTLAISGSTLTASTDGSVSAPSQPGLNTQDNVGQNIAATGNSLVFWPVGQDSNKFGISHLSASSATFTVLTAGKYLVTAELEYNNGTPSIGFYSQISINGSSTWPSYRATICAAVGASNATVCPVSGVFVLSANDTIQVKARDDASVNLLGGSTLDIQKLW